MEGFAPIVEVEWIPRLVLREEQNEPDEGMFPDGRLWLELRTVLLEALRKFPEAAQAVSDGIGRWWEGRTGDWVLGLT